MKPRNFTKIAKEINSQRPRRGNVANKVPTHRDAERFVALVEGRVLDALAHSLADGFADFTRFNRTRFLAACGVA
jgi:hypothetical protein